MFSKGRHFRGLGKLSIEWGTRHFDIHRGAAEVGGFTFAAPLLTQSVKAVAVPFGARLFWILCGGGFSDRQGNHLVGDEHRTDQQQGKNHRPGKLGGGEGDAEEGWQGHGGKPKQGIPLQQAFLIGAFHRLRLGWLCLARFTDEESRAVNRGQGLLAFTGETRRSFWRDTSNARRFNCENFTLTSARPGLPTAKSPIAV